MKCFRCTLIFLATFYFVGTWADVFDDISHMLNTTIATAKPKSRSPMTTNNAEEMKVVSLPAQTLLELKAIIDKQAEDNQPDLGRRSHKSTTDSSPEVNRADKEKWWIWDKWCQHQAKFGNCTSNMKMYYYDALVDECREFGFSGCNGNRNIFASFHECTKTCKGYGLTFEAKSFTRSEICSLQPNPGNCLAFMNRFYFDVNTRTCKMFVFGGCGGNPNRFNDRNSCMTTCQYAAI